MSTQRASGWSMRVGAGLVALCAAVSGPKAEATATVTIDEIAAGIQQHITAKSNAEGGYFRIKYDKAELKLQLVRVHLEYLADLGHGVHFACVDMVGTDGPVYDVDFFLKGPAGAMTVTATSVHKVNGKPLYAWEQKKGTWRKVPAKKATPRLLGILNGVDRFEFLYRVTLPEITSPAKLWLPLAQSDSYQKVEVESVITPGNWRELEDGTFANKVVFFTASPADSGKKVEVRYRVTRFEKSTYATREGGVTNYLAPERLVPLTENFREVAARLTAGKTNDLERARALYDYVIQTLRYAKYGQGWGRGDAVYACDVRSGNCSDFHAYFIALARAAGIPARFAIGAAIPSERNDGGIDGYHCWAEFYADGKWVPVDISEANKNPVFADYYFGHHPANRIELSRGRDLVLDPGPASGPINFLAYPVMEMEGKTIKPGTEFIFRRPG